MASLDVTSDVEKGSEDIRLSKTNISRLPDIHFGVPLRDIVLTSVGNLIVLHHNSPYKGCGLSRVNTDTSIITQIPGSIEKDSKRITRENDTRFIVLNGYTLSTLSTVCLNGNTLDSFPTPGGTYQNCFDVDMIETFMVMSFDDGTIRIKPLKGRTNAPSAQGFLISRVASPNETYFERCVCLVREKNVPVAYVSDNGSLESNQVTKFSMDGKVLKVYNDWRYSQAGLIAATGDGHVFVEFSQANKAGSCCIQLIAPSMENAITVLTTADFIRTPISMRYDQNKKRLYVINQIDVKIMVFEFN